MFVAPLAVVDMPGCMFPCADAWLFCELMITLVFAALLTTGAGAEHFPSDWIAFGGLQDKQAPLFGL